jgi:hypothetical protein
MTNPVIDSLSRFEDENQPTPFTLLKRISDSNSPVLKVSLDFSTEYEPSIPESPIKRSMPKKRSEPSFPVDLDDTYRVPSKARGIYSADPWPVGFQEEEWDEIWNSAAVTIDPFLCRYEYTNPLKQLAVSERQFKGAPWRLTIDPSKNRTRIPTFVHGTTLSYLNCSRRNARYIIDHCAFQDDSTAYLRVLCYSSRKRIYDAQSRYPPFILAVPTQYCNVRIHPDFENIVIPTPEPSTPVDLPRPLPSYFSADENDTGHKDYEYGGWKEWLSRMCCMG